MDDGLITKNYAFFSMVPLSEEKLAVCQQILGLSLQKEFLRKTIRGGGGIATSQKGRIPRAPKRKKSNKKAAKRPRSASHAE